MKQNASIYGYSDDTILLDGVQNTDDFSVYSHPHGELHCSDGTILEYHYNGTWDFIVKVKGTQFDRIDPWIDETVDYSDNVHFNGILESVMLIPDRKRGCC